MTECTYFSKRLWIVLVVWLWYEWLSHEARFSGIFNVWLCGFCYGVSAPGRHSELSVVQFYTDLCLTHSLCVLFISSSHSIVHNSMASVAFRNPNSKHLLLPFRFISQYHSSLSHETHTTSQNNSFCSNAPPSSLRRSMATFTRT